MRHFRCLTAVAVLACARCVPLTVTQDGLEGPPDAQRASPYDSGIPPLLPASDAGSPIDSEDDLPQSADDAGLPLAKDASSAPEDPLETNPLAGLPTGAAQLGKLCARGASNAITAVFCAASTPRLTSLAEVQTLLGLAFQDANGGNGEDGNPGFAINGHSSSLVAHSVSAINPRVILFTPGRNARPDRNVVFLGFVRGDHFVELAVSPPQGPLTFYLLTFEQPCSAAKNCRPGDVLTPAIETGWTSWTLYEDSDLENTVLDCLHCHQTAGPQTPKILRMQELERPWTHWFRAANGGGGALLADYFRAHGNSEVYGGVPATMIARSDPQELEDIVRDLGFADQPNEFDGDSIESEVESSADGQPAVNVPPGSSATWQRLWDRAAAGEAIPPPYHDVKVTDPTKLANMTAAYQAFVDGTAPAADLPDLRDVFLEDAKWKLSFTPRPGANAREMIVQMCAQCHNPRLDQTISRATFDALNLDALPAQAKAEAIARLGLPPEDRRAMPPHHFKSLTLEQRNLMILELQK